VVAALRDKGLIAPGPQPTASKLCRGDRDLRGAVRKGETGSMVVFAIRFTNTETDAAGGTRSGAIDDLVSLRSGWPLA